MGIQITRELQSDSRSINSHIMVDLCCCCPCSERLKQLPLKQMLMLVAGTLVFLGLYNVATGIEAELYAEEGDSLTIFEFATFIVVGIAFCAVAGMIYYTYRFAKKTFVFTFRLLAAVCAIVAVSGLAYLCYKVSQGFDGFTVAFQEAWMEGVLIGAILGTCMGAVVLYYLSYLISEAVFDGEPNEETPITGGDAA